MKEFLKQLTNYTLSYLPRGLPVGRGDFDGWAAGILSLARVPDNDSTRYALATMILHLGPTESTKAPQYFIRALDKGAANQVAASVFQEIQAKQKEAMRVEQAKLAEQNGIGSNTLGTPDVRQEVLGNG